MVVVLLAVVVVAVVGGNVPGNRLFCIVPEAALSDAESLGAVVDAVGVQELVAHGSTSDTTVGNDAIVVEITTGAGSGACVVVGGLATAVIVDVVTVVIVTVDPCPPCTNGRVTVVVFPVVPEVSVTTIVPSVGSTGEMVFVIASKLFVSIAAGMRE